MTITRAILVNNSLNYVAYAHQRQEGAFETRPHATIEALIKARRTDVAGATLYLWRYPCFECAKAIVYAGIVKVVYKYENSADATHTEAEMFLRESGVEVVRNENLDF